VKDKVLLRCRDGRCAAGQGLIGTRHFKLFREGKHGAIS
jgi:hypothetical protein